MIVYYKISKRVIEICSDKEFQKIYTKGEK